MDLKKIQVIVDNANFFFNKAWYIIYTYNFIYIINPKAL